MWGQSNNMNAEFKSKRSFIAVIQKEDEITEEGSKRTFSAASYEDEGSRPKVKECRRPINAGKYKKVGFFP